MKTSTIALSIAVLWIVALVTLLVGFSGSAIFEVISVVTSILAGIGMAALVWNLNGPPSDDRKSINLTFGVVGAVVYIVASLLVIVEFRSFDELSAWVMAGTAIYGVWMLLYSAPSSTSSSMFVRGLGIAVGVGFVLLAISVASIGTLDPTSDVPSDTSQVMVLAQYVGGGLAYLAFPLWLFLLARTVREPQTIADSM